MKSDRSALGDLGAMAVNSEFVQLTGIHPLPSARISSMPAAMYARRMSFRPYHTGLRKSIDLVPLHPGEVRMYNCGPTVYGIPHIGNFRAYVFADLLRRFLSFKGLGVRQVMNITDVGHLTQDDAADASGEDKLQKTARELGWDPFKVARHFEGIFHANRKALNILDAEHYPRATEHICEQLALMQTLIDKGHAYVVEASGEVYYRIRSFARYGELSGKQLEELVAGARVEVNSAKEHPHDFALWKTDAGHLMQWDPHADETWKDYDKPRPRLDPRIRKGFPGWHIECSAMAMRYLGQSFDIHTGGEDNIFPHHECEIAQSEGATGETFVRCWMHTRHLMVDGKKMSKRAGTLYTLDDIVARGYSPLDLRYYLLSVHYRQPMNFTFEGLDAAREARKRIQTCYELLHELVHAQPGESAYRRGGGGGGFGGGGGGLPSGMGRGGGGSWTVSERTDLLISGVLKALDDDLNSANALAELFNFIVDINFLAPTGSEAEEAIKAFDEIDRIFGVLSTVSSRLLALAEMQSLATSAVDHEALLKVSSLTIQQIEQLLAARYAAKKRKDFATADAIRSGLGAKGISIEDVKDGVRYRVS